ncbi:unnamed protein product, partial [Ixodes hexagonus]
LLVTVLGTVTFTFFYWLHQKRTLAFRDAAFEQNVSNACDSKFWNPEEDLRVGYGGLPFPVESTDCLPTAYCTVAACQKKPKFLFFVHTAPGNFEHRAILRGCLGNRNFSAYYRWTTVFFVGLSADNATAKLVEEEASQHGDVVVLPYVDTYRNLTYKFVYGIKWTIENCQSVTYIVKMDDDFAVNVLKVMNYLESHLKPEKLEFHCFVHAKTPVSRNVNSKWYLSQKVYPKKKFPPYCGGGSTMFTAGALRGLYNASFALHFHPIDDVYVTGEASVLAGVKLIDIKKTYSYFAVSQLEVTSGKVMFSHLQNHTVRASAWTSISQSL